MNIADQRPGQATALDSRPHGSLPRPLLGLQDFAKAGASYITFHPEASNHVDRSLQVRQC